MYFIEPSAEETVADVGNENSTGKKHKEPSAEHGAVSAMAHSSKGDFFFLYYCSNIRWRQEMNENRLLPSFTPQSGGPKYGWTLSTVSCTL